MMVKSRSINNRPQNEPMTVAVLMGGISSEREISIQSGQCVASALSLGGYNVIEADITPDDLAILDDSRIDVFFPVLHGRFGEDGTLQQIMEDKNLTYCGSDPSASRLAFNKVQSKQIFSQAGITTPPFVYISSPKQLDGLDEQTRQFGNKFVVKPSAEGSSVGITICSDAETALAAAKDCFEQFGDAMVEKFIPGKELTVSVLANQPLEIIEIISKNAFYDYNAKYADNDTQYLFDSLEGYSLNANLKSAAMNCFESLGCRDFARVDFILGENEIAWALEVNTIPGFTNHSLLPKAAKQAGISMPELCGRIVELAVERAEVSRL